MLACPSCGHYQNPQKVLIYPNTDNELVGWRVCGVGNVINRTTLACQWHTAGAQEGIPEQPVQQPKTVKPKAQPKPAVEVKPELEPEISSLLGGIDFEGMLEDEINKIGARR